MSFTAYLDNCCSCEPCGEGKAVAASGSDVPITSLIRPALDSDNYVAWVCLPPGVYKVWPCRGAWQYYDSAEGIALHGGSDWVFSRVPVSGADITSRVSAGETAYKRHFYVIKYKSQGAAAIAAFGDAVPDGYGGASYAAAETVGKAGGAITITHSGGAIGIDFKDNLKTDNSTTGVAPTFGIECIGGVTPFAAQFITAPAAGSVIGTNRYRVPFKVNNNLFAMTGVTVTLQSTGGIASPSAPVTADFALGASTVTFDFSLSDPLNKAVTATLAFSGSVMDDCGQGIDLGTVAFDLTPALALVVVDGTHWPLGTVHCGISGPLDCRLQVHHVNGLPVERLQLTVTGSAAIKFTVFTCGDPPFSFDLTGEIGGGTGAVLVSASYFVAQYGSYIIASYVEDNLTMSGGVLAV